MSTSRKKSTSKAKKSEESAEITQEQPADESTQERPDAMSAGPEKDAEPAEVRVHNPTDLDPAKLREALRGPSPADLNPAFY